MSQFTIASPTDVGGVLNLLQEEPEDTFVYAGGTELMAAVKEGMLQPRFLVDLKRLPTLKEVTFTEAGARVGATVTYRHLLGMTDLLSRFPILGQVMRQVGNVRVRTSGTPVGNICFGEPHSDVATVLSLLGCEVTIAGESVRRATLDDFIVDAFETDLGPQEIVTDICIPALGPNVRCGYATFRMTERPAVAVAAAVETDGDSLKSIEVVVGAIGPKPQRIDGLSALHGTSLADAGARLEEAAYQVASSVGEVLDEGELSEEYRRHLSGHLFIQAAQQAITQARRELGVPQ